jgi:hypothetical protein
MGLECALALVPEALSGMDGSGGQHLEGDPGHRDISHDLDGFLRFEAPDVIVVVVVIVHHPAISSLSTGTVPAEVSPVLFWRRRPIVILMESFQVV